MKRIKFVFVLLAILLLAVTVQAQSQPDSFVLTWSRQPDGLFLDYAATSTASYAASAIYNSLVANDLDGNLVGELAESWEVSEDQLTWTFNLREGVLWHDGAPFTAADVKFSYEFPADPEYTGSGFNANIKGATEKQNGEADEVEGVQVIDDYTIAITTVEPYALFLDTIAQRYIVPEHILGDIPVAELGSSDQVRSPIGTGPYRLIEWRPDELLTFERFEDYWGEPAKIKNYFWRVIPDRSVQITELLNGAVDVVPEVMPDEFPDLQENPNITTLQLPGVNTPQILMNQNNPIFQDVRVRKAIAYAIDRQAINAAVAGGLGGVYDSLIHPSLPQYNPNLTLIPYDPEMARALLDEAGWRDEDGDGIREAHDVAGVEDGTPFNIEFGSFAFSPYSDSAQIIQQYLKEVGIETTLNLVDFNIYFSEYITATSDYAMAMSGWFNFVTPVHNEFFASYVSTAPNTQWVHWVNPEVDELVSEAAVTFDPEERNAIYHRIQEIVQEEVPYVYVFRPDNLIAYNARLNIPEIGSLTALFNSIPEWEWTE